MVYPGGACQTSWLREGIVLLTKAGGGSAGLPWRVVAIPNSIPNPIPNRKKYATDDDPSYEKEMREYAKKTGNSEPDKDHSGGPRYGYLH